MKQSTSTFIDVRGLRYHIRGWGESGQRKIFMLHGWMDNSASFQFLVDCLKGEYHVLAPDWRGCGLSEWSGDGSYWINDYLGDMHVLMERLQPESPVDLICHSLGFNIASMYGGIRPERVARLVNLECHGYRDIGQDLLPLRYAEWFDDMMRDHSGRSYDSFTEVEDRLRKGNPSLTMDQVAFLARNVAAEDGSGSIRMLNDPVLKGSPSRMIYTGALRLDDALSCWRRVIAPILWFEGGKSDIPRIIAATPEQLRTYKAAFKSVTYHLLPDAGHAIHIEQAATLAPMIEEFLASGSATA